MGKLIIIIVTAFLLLTLPSGAVFADGQGKGPAEKATGWVSIDNSTGQGDWYAEFNAHEAKDNRPAKGTMRTWNDTISRDLQYDVVYVNVDGDTAWFAAQCTYDSAGKQVGKWLFIKVDDGGEPGWGGVDHIGWDWNSTSETNASNRVTSGDTPANWWTIDEGNLQVHTR